MSAIEIVDPYDITKRSNDLGRRRLTEKLVSVLALLSALLAVAILGAAIPLAAALREGWQFAVLGAAAIALLIARRGIVVTLLGAGVVGVVAALAGAPVPL